MVKYTPFFVKGDAFDKALDACHQAGIGLVAMKTLRNAADAPKRLPEFDKLGLTTHQALLQAVWSDPRISAVCNRMQNVDNIQTSVAAVRAYKGPLKFAQLGIAPGNSAGQPPHDVPRLSFLQSALAQNWILRSRTFRDTSCITSRTATSGRASCIINCLPLHRDASQVDLAALRDACHFKVDYPEIIRRAERYFA